MKEMVHPRIKTTSIIQKYGIYFVFAAIVVALTCLTAGKFVSSANIVNVLRQISINAIIAVGMTLVIITGGIDLSVGSILAFAGIIATDLAHPDSPYSLVVVILVALAIGCICGLINGLIISYVGAPAFVVTLGMMSAARGATQIYCGGAPITNLSADFEQLGKGSLLGIPIPVIILAIVVVLAFVLLHQSKFGRALYAVGSNEEAAYASGVNVKVSRTLAYMISGLCCGLCGIILAARTSAASALAGEGYELNAIAATVIGGTSLAGGKGTIIGTLIGALIIGSISNGLDLLNVSSYVQQVVKGAIIIGAVCLDARAAVKKR